jgi:serine/threonine-protein kinase
MNASTNEHRAPSRLGLLLLAFLLAGFVAFIGHSSKQLPDRVATHFDLHGKPNGWMTRAQHVKFSVGVGVGTPVLVVGVFALVRKTKGWGLNIPNKAFWLAPERQQTTFAFLRRHGYWLAGSLVIFHAGLFESVVLANSRTPAYLAPTHVAWLTGGFLVFLAIWIAVLFARFRRPVA